jgi:CHAD domain-containing protein
MEHEQGVRALDPRSIHKMRAGIRRVRALLLTLDPILADEWVSDRMRALRWFSSKLGAVRDLDVLKLRFEAETSGAALSTVREAIESERTEATGKLLAALVSVEFKELKQWLPRAGASLPVERDADGVASECLPELVRSQWRKLKRLVRCLPEDQITPEYHDARKQAKTLRYAIECIAPFLGARERASAEGFCKRVAGLQTCLGELQDAVMAQDWLESRFGDAEHRSRTYRLVERAIEWERRAGEAVLRTFPELWRRVDRKKRRRWMKSRHA